MITLEIPDFKKLDLSYLILDYNGTIAKNGKLIKGVEEKIKKLSDKLKIIVITADTFGTVKENLQHFPIEVKIIAKNDQRYMKLQFIKEYIPEKCVCIGNGRNDELMLKTAGLGIAVLGSEGLYSGLVNNSDILVKSIDDALDLLLNPQRIIATLRN